MRACVHVVVSTCVCLYTSVHCASPICLAISLYLSIYLAYLSIYLFISLCLSICFPRAISGWLSRSMYLSTAELAGDCRGSFCTYVRVSLCMALLVVLLASVLWFFSGLHHLGPESSEGPAGLCGLTVSAASSVRAANTHVFLFFPLLFLPDTCSPCALPVSFRLLGLPAGWQLRGRRSFSSGQANISTTSKRFLRTPSSPGFWVIVSSLRGLWCLHAVPTIFFFLLRHLEPFVLLSVFPS